VGRRVTGRRPDAVILTDDDEPVPHPFGGYSLETETLPDGRTIRYYAWPADTATEPADPRTEPDEP
jgi:hypothetical protein